MPKHRRLTDLYVRGKDVTFDDGEGEEITVYVKKLNPVSHEKAMRSANAARSRTLALRGQRDTDDFHAMWAEVEDYQFDDLLNYIVLEESSKREPAVEAELAGEEEWAKEDYLQGLRDAWQEGLDERYATDPTDADAKACFDELQRFMKQVTDVMEGEADKIRADFEHKPIDVLRDNVFERVIGMQASLAWLAEYRRQEVFHGTFEPDRKTRYFTSRAEVDEIPAEVYVVLTTTYREISVDPTEGKGSEGTLSSSISSVALDEVETGVSSGPEAASQ
jgi:hypothetical protein